MHAQLLASALLFLNACHLSGAQLIVPNSLPALTPEGQLPFLADDWDASTRHVEAGPRWERRTGGRAPRFAIIGGGAGGSSAAYFLAHFARLKDEGLATDVTLFESTRIGGRASVVAPWDSDPESPKSDDDEPVECGASIFVSANKNLQRAAKAFNLTLVEPLGEDGKMSIWDGSSFVFTETGGKLGYWDLAKMWWRYGRSPLKVRSLVKTTVASFLRLYEPDFISSGAFTSLLTFASSTNLSRPATQNAKAYLDREGISELFTTELVAAATQVNYGTPVTQIHGVGALVSLAATGAVAIEGGNKRIFEAFLGSSEARLRLGEEGTVKEIVKLDADKGERPQWVVKTASGGGGTFDIVILAAPFHQTGISVHNSAMVIPRQEYVQLHVTFVITNASAPQASYFGLPLASSMPNTIFGTWKDFDEEQPSPTLPTFNSLNYLRTLSNSTGAKFGEGTWHVVKMFSEAKLGEDMLRDLFGATEVGKSWEKVWLAYPKLDPIRSSAQLAPVRPDVGFYYVNGFERLISTMETETVSSFNVVSLLLNDLYGYTPPRSWAEWDAESASDVI